MRGNDLYVASKVKHQSNSWYIGVYYIGYSSINNLFHDLSLTECLLDPLYRSECNLTVLFEVNSVLYTPPHTLGYALKCTSLDKSNRTGFITLFGKYLDKQ